MYWVNKSKDQPRNIVLIEKENAPLVQRDIFMSNAELT